MSEPIYLAIEYFTEQQLNPYYSYGNRCIEAEFIEVEKSNNVFLYSDDELAKYLDNDNTKARTVKFFKIQQINPSVNRTITLSSA